MVSRIRNILIVFVTVLLGVFLFVPTPVVLHAQATTPNPCQTMLQEYTTWATQPGHILHFFMITNGRSNRPMNVVGYAEGTLRFRSGAPGSAAYLSGVGTQFFNDRRWSRQAYPFNPEKVDQLGVDINLATGQITLTLLSWGNARYIIIPSCVNDVLIGTAAGTTNPQILSLSKEDQLAPPSQRPRPPAVPIDPGTALNPVDG